MFLKSRISYLFVLLLFFGVVLFCRGDNDSETVVVFKENQPVVPYSEDKSKGPFKIPELFTAPAFVGGMYNNKEFFAVLFTGMFEYSVEESYIDMIVRASYGNYRQWTPAEIITNVSKMNKTNKLRGDTTAVMKENKIYVLTTSIDTVKTQEGVGISEVVRDPLMIVGTILNSTSSTSNSDDVFIKWGPVTSIKKTLPNTIHGTEGSKFIGGDGNGIATTNGTIIFPIVMQLSGGVRMASILYSNDNGSTWHIGGETEQNTGVGSIVEWSDGKLLFTVASDDGYRKVFESNDMGTTWQRSLLFFGVWGNNIKRHAYESQGSVIKVPVNNKNVFLFSHPLNKRGNYDFDILQLWLSDGQRIMCVGTISDKEKEVKTGHSILAYVNEHLYVTHEINPFFFSSHDSTGLKDQWKNVIGLTPLPKFFETVTTTVGDWEDIDEFYDKSGIPTKSLVGVLGNTTEGEAVWTDMYNCVNATVKGGKPVDGGFRFDGKPGSGAKWPVASQGQNQLYMFTQKEFTITATVTMHDTNGDKDVLLLGASKDDDGNNVLIGIGYTKEKKWFALQNTDNKTNTGDPVVQDKKYQVTLTFAKEIGSVYLDGVEIASTKITLSEKDPISHFFIGKMETNSEETSNSYTVKNVMLFSRALNKEQIVQVTKMKESNETYKKTTKEKAIIVTESSKSNLKIKISNEPEIIKAMQTNISHEAVVLLRGNATKVKGNDKQIINSLNEYRNTTFQKDVEGDKSAPVSLYAVAWMCVACSFIVAIGL